MTTRQLKLYSQQTNGNTWADPSDPDYTVRFKTNASPKSIDGQRTTNYMTEIIVNDNYPVSVGGKDVVDALSVRIRTSGAIESISQLNAMVDDVVSQLKAVWLADDVLSGFPVSAVTREVE